MLQTSPKRRFDGSGNTFATLASLWPYIWPQGRSDLKQRVVIAMVLLVVSKVLTVLVPYAYKWAVDALEGGAGFAVGVPDWLKLAAVPAFLVIAYGVGRFLAFGFQQVRDAIFARVGQHAVVGNDVGDIADAIQGLDFNAFGDEAGPEISIVGQVSAQQVADVEIL